MPEVPTGNPGANSSGGGVCENVKKTDPKLLKPYWPLPGDLKRLMPWKGYFGARFPI